MTELEIVNYTVVNVMLFFVLIGVLQLGVQPYDSEHKYFTNDNTILHITASKNE